MTDDLQLFLDDATEHLDEADRAVLRLDAALQAGEAPSAEAVNAVFRCVHTIKGNAGLMGFGGCVAIAHALESGLARVRAGALTLDAEHLNEAFAGLDALRTLVGAVVGDYPVPFDAAAVAAAIEARFALQGPTGADDFLALFPGWTLCAPARRPALAQRLAAGEGQLYRLSWPLAAAPADPEAADDFERLRALGSFVAWRVVPSDPHFAQGAYLTQATPAEFRRFGPESLGECVPFVAEPVAAAAPAARVAAPAPESSIRVSTALLDALMNLVGELVLTRNQILQHLRRQEEPALNAPVHRLNHLTTELQEAVMRTRLQPVGQVWDKFPRLVRDYCQASGKQVALTLEGVETELDKSLLEAIKDPLTHLVRNALDHGIEAPAARLAAGKEARGTVRLAASQDGGQVIIDVVDDGRGLDLDRVRAKAIGLGLGTAEALDRLSEAELAKLIFHPGFSTAAEVTAISGRGVGMDVVKANIERIGGTIELASEPGRGMAFRLRIPLTLAVIPALVIHAGGERFALPQAGVLEVVSTGAGLQRIEQVRDALVYRLRDALVPVLPLHEALGLGAGDAGLEAAQLVVVQAGSQVFGLAIDAIGDTEEIVVKPLHPFLRGLAAYAGVTIMGDGRACMILDVAGLAQSGGLAALGAPTDGLALAPPGELAEAAPLQLLLCRLGERTFGLPMAQVSRLEAFAQDQLERLGDRLVIQYGEGLLPVLRPEGLLGLPAPDAQDTASVIVLDAEAGLVGLRVQAIADIVETHAPLHPVKGVPGVLGAVVIAGVTTEVLDVAALLAADPHAQARPPALLAAPGTAAVPSREVIR